MLVKYNRPRHLRRPPVGRCFIDRLPDELWLEVLSYLDWEQLVRIRRTSRRTSVLALAPSLLRTVAITLLPSRRLPLVLRDSILPYIRHLSVSDSGGPTSFTWTPRGVTFKRRSPFDSLLDLLRSVPSDQVLSLAIDYQPIPGPWDRIGAEIVRIGSNLQRLELHGARLDLSNWGDWIQDIAMACGGLRELDLGLTSIEELPRNLPVGNLEVLSLRGCYSLEKESLLSFLADLPPSLRVLDLSGLNQVTLDALYDLPVVCLDSNGSSRSTRLNTVHLVGIDHLTRSDVRALQRHWSRQRDACLEGYPTQRVAARLTAKSISPSSSYASSLLAESLGPRSTSSSPIPPMPSSPESDSSEVMPRTPNWRDTPSPEPSSAWELGALGDAMYSYSPTQRLSPAIVFPIKPPRAARYPTTSSPKVTIFHSALLESDDEAGYRRFIGEVVDGTLGSDWGEFRDDGL